jgi:hypothetical protein
MELLLILPFTAWVYFVAKNNPNYDGSPIESTSYIMTLRKNQL